MSGKMKVNRKPNLYYTREINAIFEGFARMSETRKKKFLEFFRLQIIPAITNEKARDFIFQIYELLSQKAA